MFKVGQKVVCINAKSANELDKGSRDFGSVVQDATYIIEKIEYHFRGECLGFVTVPRMVFDSFDFRPLDYAFVEEVIKNVISKEELV